MSHWLIRIQIIFLVMLLSSIGLWVKPAHGQSTTPAQEELRKLIEVQPDFKADLTLSGLINFKKAGLSFKIVVKGMNSRLESYVNIKKRPVLAEIKITQRSSSGDYQYIELDPESKTYAKKMEKPADDPLPTGSAYLEGANKVELIGKKMVNGHNCIVIKASYDNGEAAILYLAEDLKNLIIKVETNDADKPDKFQDDYLLSNITLDSGTITDDLFEIPAGYQKDKINDLNYLYDLQLAAQDAFDKGNFDKARELANQILSNDPEKSSHEDQFHHATLILGRLALKNGDLAKAKSYLLTSVQSGSGPVMQSFGPNMKLAEELLIKGEKEVVLEYLHLCARFWKSKHAKKDLMTWEAEVKAGKIPDFSANLSY